MSLDTGKDVELKRLWEEAVEEYSSKSKRRSNMPKWKQALNAETDLEKLIEQHESEFAQFRNRRGKFWGGFLITMKGLQKLGKFAQAGIGLTPFAPASIIVEAGLFLIDSGSAVADVYDSLEELFKRIREITDRLGEYLKGTIDSKLRKVVIKLLCALLDVFYEAEAAIKRGRGKEMMRRVVGRENQIQTALDKLDAMVKTEMDLITAMTYATVQGIDQKAEADRNRELFRQTLCVDAADDNDVFHAGIESSRLKLSGDWLLKGGLFERWVQMEFPVLWILGRPGTGKTYLASRVLSHLRQNPSTNIASYFYIREGMNTQHTPEVVLKTIAYQITKLHDSYRTMAVRICQDSKNLLSASSIWDSLFVKLFEADSVASRPLFVVIDGVDEATQANQELLVKLAKSLSDSRSNKQRLPAIQLLLLGRPDLDYNVTNEWRGELKRPRIIHVQPSSSRADIERFIKKGIEGIHLLKRMPSDPSNRLRKRIIKTLSNSADGMFMLAKLMLAEIKDMNKPELIKKALAKPPLGLEDMFKRVVTRLTAIGGFDKKDLNEIIMWVACVKRDLLLGELDLILKVRDITQNGIVGLDDELRTRFGSFFSVANPEADINDEANELTIDDDDTRSPSAPARFAERETEDHGASDDLSDVDDDDEDYGDYDESDIDDGDDDEDDEDEHQVEDDVIPDQYLVATVKFGHASVGQYFRAAPFHEGIGMDVNLAQAHIATTCLLFLNGNIAKRNEKPWRQPDLVKYAADHFLDHLDGIQLERLESFNPVEFKKLSREIAVLFRDQSALYRWFQSVSDEQRFMSQLFSHGICSRLRSCIPQPTDGVMGQEAQWMKEAKISSMVLLEPFAKSVCKVWLQTELVNSIAPVLFLDGYKSTGSDSAGDWELPPNRPFEHIAERISPEEIHQMALICEMEKTGEWHLALGYTFRRISTTRHTLAAIEEFKLATDKSDHVDTIWRGHTAQASAFYFLEDYGKAIEAASISLETLPSFREGFRIGLLGMILNSNVQLGNSEAAIATSLKALESAPDSPNSIFTVIYAYHRAGRFSDTVNIIRSRLTGEDSEHGADVIGEVMKQEKYTAEFISIACTKTGQLDLARDTFMAVANRAAESGNSEVRAIANVALAQLYYSLYKDEIEAVKIWENIVKDYPGTSAALTASFALAPFYFTNAMDEGATDSDAWILKLEQLVKQWELHKDPGDDALLHIEQLSALLGRWYAQRGEVDRARAMILPLMKMAIRDLADRDDKNDLGAYVNLGKSLLCFRDLKNAKIAFAFVAPLRKSKELLELEARENGNEPVEAKSSVNEGNPEPDVPFGFKGNCDGRCSRLEVEFRSFSLCEICANVGFCDECRLKRTDGTISFQICSPKHPLLEVYPPKGLVTKEAEGYRVKISDEKTVSSSEWLAMISREWLGA